MVLFRRLLGDVLRSQRIRKGRTLRQVSADARVSLGYISEIERGQKEASSELLASICAALDIPLSEVLRAVSDAIALEEAALGLAIEEATSLGTTSIEVPDTAPDNPGDVVASAA
jgi:transcriptional regulator with XRE-family HTH domain